MLNRATLTISSDCSSRPRRVAVAAEGRMDRLLRTAHERLAQGDRLGFGRWARARGRCAPDERCHPALGTSCRWSQRVADVSSERCNVSKPWRAAIPR